MNLLSYIRTNYNMEVAKLIFTSCLLLLVSPALIDSAATSAVGRVYTETSESVHSPQRPLDGLVQVVGPVDGSVDNSGTVPIINEDMGADRPSKDQATVTSIDKDGTETSPDQDTKENDAGLTGNPPTAVPTPAPATATSKPGPMNDLAQIKALMTGIFIMVFLLFVVQVWRRLAVPRPARAQGSARYTPVKLVV